MFNIRNLVLLISMIVLSNQSHAEIYKDFYPNDSLASIKSKYPNAHFEQIKAAWVKENEAFIGLTGLGIVGNINLKFSTIDNVLIKIKQVNQEEIDKNPTTDNSKREETIKWINDSLSLPLDQRLTLDWLRWVPSTPNIPFERIVDKYGKPEKCDNDAESFQPFCSWPSKGVSVNLSDDKKFVYSIEYWFTDEDRGIKPPETPPPKPKNSQKSKTKTNSTM